MLQSIGNSLPVKTYQTENNIIQAAYTFTRERAVYQFVDRFLQTALMSSYAIQRQGFDWL